jgi:hypothetical protein
MKGGQSSPDHRFKSEFHAIAMALGEIRRRRQRSLAGFFGQGRLSFKPITL